MNSTLIKNVTVLTMDDADRVFAGWLLLRDGKIAALGEGAPQDITADETIDGAGGVLLPGLVDMHSHLGLYEYDLGFEGADGNEDTDPVTPQLRALDGINPMDAAFAESLAAGVTAVGIAPGSANAIGGQIVALKTYGRRVDDMILRQPLAMKFALGENPKSVYHDKDETPVTRMATAALVREQLGKAQEYLRQKEKAAADPDESEPDFDLKLEALVPLLKGEMQAHFHAHRADDMFTALRIAKEFSLHAVLVHGTEGHLVADILAAEGVPVLAGPCMTDRSKPELRHLSATTPKVLQAAGVPTAITVDHPEIPLRLLTVAVQQAVRAGLDEHIGLRMITAEPAKIVGLYDRIGSLEPGKDGDCVLFSGAPLDYRSVVRAVFVDGVMRWRGNDENN